jgi:hypothetical protein
MTHYPCNFAIVILAGFAVLFLLGWIDEHQRRINESRHRRRVNMTD